MCMPHTVGATEPKRPPAAPSASAWRTELRAPDTLTATGHKSGWGWTYGAGATFAITPTVQLRADWDRYKLDFANGRSDVDMLSAGVQFRF